MDGPRDFLAVIVGVIGISLAVDYQEHEWVVILGGLGGLLALLYALRNWA